MRAKDPHRRKSQSGSRAQANRVDGTRSKSGWNGPRSSPRAESAKAGARTFVLYVEGARDREILACWARRLDSALVQCIEENTVILGGRRPDRALADFEKRGGAAAGLCGLVLLDRDDQSDGDAKQEILSLLKCGPDQEDLRLELFVWSLRHIESYLLVPAAIRRMLRLDERDRTVENFIRNRVQIEAKTPVAERQSIRPGGSLHAKRVLGAGGALSKALGAELRAGEIARAMRAEDFHEDVHRLFEQIGRLAGFAPKVPVVVVHRA